ncbi:acyl-CoA dehydrogenase family protein, partial [Algoriphagus aestuarii]|nr:acyl-CoA dehydrogenase family protein [Algoriphagus aestuarii]
MTARPVDEYTEIRELASKVAREVYGPIAEQLDVERKPISREERIRLGELGFLGIAHQERYGGAGAPLAQALAVIEEFARVCRPAAFQIFEANTGPAQVINYLGTEEQRERWLPDIISGE